MKDSRWRRALGCGLLLLVAGAVRADTPPAWVRHHAADATPAQALQAGGVILFRDTQITVLPGGHLEVWQRRLYRVLQPQGAWLATESTLVDSRTRLERFRGWEQLPGGKWQRWRRRDAVWMNPLLEYPGYVRFRWVALTLPAPAPGTLVAFDLRRRLRPEILQHVWRFQGRVPDLDARLTVHLAPGWRALAYWRHWPAQPGRELGDVARQWQLRQVPGLPEQPEMPPDGVVAAAMFLTLAPAGPSPALSPLNARATSGWYLRLTAGRAAPTPAVRAQAAALTAGQETEAGKIAAVARFVQQKIRYAAVEIGAGNYQPHTAGTVLTGGYGDCKDKATLLIALLRALGVHADYVLLNAQRGIVPPDYASPLSFDHVIVAVRWPPRAAADRLYAWLGPPGPGHLLLFDPTDPRTPLGWLPQAEQGGEAILVSRAGGRAFRLPVLAAALNRRLRSAQFAMRGDGSLAGTVEEVRTGGFAAQASGEKALTASERRRWLARFDRVLPGIQIADWRGQQAGGTAVVQYQMTVSPYLQFSGATALLPPWLFPLPTPQLFETGVRRYRVRLGRVGSRTDLYQIRLASNLHVGALPPPVHLELLRPPGTAATALPYASYGSQMRLAQAPTGPVLHVQRTLTINVFSVPAAQYTAVERFWSQVRRDEDRVLFGRLVTAAGKAPAPAGP